MLNQVAGLMALALGAHVGGATGMPSALDIRQTTTTQSTKGGSIKVAWGLADVSFMLGQSTSVLYNVSLPEASQSISQMYFFLLKTSSPTAVSASNTVEILRLPGKCSK